jgi:hypothetical protein
MRDVAEQEEDFRGDTRSEELVTVEEEEHTAGTDAVVVAGGVDGADRVVALREANAGES